MTVYILSASVIPNYGTFRFNKITVEEARKILEENYSVSAIRHEGTAKIMSSILQREIPTNRIAINMDVNDKAIVFRLLERLPEGKILNEEELKQVKYEIALLERLY